MLYILISQLLKDSNICLITNCFYIHNYKVYDIVYDISVYFSIIYKLSKIYKLPLGF